MKRAPARHWNELHMATRKGLTKRAVALVSMGVIDIDQAGPGGSTPVMISAAEGYSRVVRLLLNKGANVAMKDDNGMTALHFSVLEGHLVVTKLLMKAGADLEAEALSTGHTPLHITAGNGHSETMSALIEAGANPSSRALDGSTPLLMAACKGHVDAINVLLRAKANPLLTAGPSPGTRRTPLEIAAQNRHLGVIHELVQQLGIEGCSGASVDVDALALAAKGQHLEVMSTLTNAGVVDTGGALLTAAENGYEAGVEFLLQQMEWTTRGERAAYLHYLGPGGHTPLLGAVLIADFSSSRIVRLLVGAGADAASPVRLTDETGRVFFNDTTLVATTDHLRRKRVGGGQVATGDQLHSLEASRRLLLRLEAVHAASWLWTSGAPSFAHAAAPEGATAWSLTTPVILMLPILRQRARRPRVLLAALSRHSRKPY